MKWFKRHLNLALILGIMVIELPLGIYALIYQSMLDDTISMLAIYNITYRYNYTGLFIWLVLAIIAELTLEVWYLHQKKRNYAFLLLNFIKPLYIPVGFILLLCLGNKRVVTTYPEDKVVL